MRFCVDPRPVNEVTIADAARMPRGGEILESLKGAKIFSKMDLMSGYWQIPLKKRPDP